MPELYLLPRPLSKASPGLRNIAWRFEALLSACLLSLLGSLSLERSTRIAGAMMRALAPHLRKWRIVRRNLSLAFRDEDPRGLDVLARGVFSSLSTSLMELVHLNSIWDERDTRLQFVVEDGAQPTLDRNQAAVYIIAHVGAWPLAPFVAAHYGLTTSIIYAPESNPYLEKVFQKLRTAFPCRTVSRDGGMRALMRELQAGHSVGLTVDTRMNGGAMIPFFGIDAPTNTAPARLALRHQCDLVPIVVDRLPETRYRVRVCTPIQPDDPEAPVTEQASSMTRQLNALLEGWIRRVPDQWLCLKRRWPKEAYETARIGV